MIDCKFGLRGHDIADNFRGMCKLAKQKNISKLQFALAKTMSDIDFDRLGYDEALAKNIANELTENNLEVSVLGCYINPVDSDLRAREIQIERFKNFLRYAKVLNAGGVGTETGSVGDLTETRSEKNYKDFLNTMLPVISLAEELNVNVYIEPVSCFTIYSPQSMKRMIDDIKSDRLKVILDISNMISDDVSMQQRLINDSFDLLGDKIRVIHLKDFVFKNGIKHFTSAGSGGLDVALLFKRINELENAPDIILDETPIEIYDDTLAELDRFL